MKNPTLIASLLIFLLTTIVSSNAFARANNCHTLWPKVPYSCKLVAKAKAYPSERADFSAFETGTVQASVSKHDHPRYTLQSVSRDSARKLASQKSEIAN